MARILVFSTDKQFNQLWYSALSDTHEVNSLVRLPESYSADLVIIDVQQIEQNNELILTFSQNKIRTLIAGNKWPEKAQIHALMQGATGYCNLNEPPELFTRAVDTILKGDIWIQRHLIPLVIGALVKLNNKKEQQAVLSNYDSELLLELSPRELEVANMVGIGENNKEIAKQLTISERTVKAHLTSTFKKLKVVDRLHLALLMKENTGAEPLKLPTHTTQVE